MSRFGKWFIGIFGFIVFLAGAVLVALSINVSPVSDWLTTLLQNEPQVSQWLLVGLGSLTGVTGILLLMFAFFKTRTVREVRLQETLGKIVLPVGAMEHDLQRQIADVVAVSRPEVRITMHARKRLADVQVNAVATGAKSFKTIGSEVLTVVKQYLEENLAFKVRHQRIRVTPVTDTNVKARVV